jgi:hypothetical protein
VREIESQDIENEIKAFNKLFFQLKCNFTPTLYDAVLEELEKLRELSHKSMSEDLLHSIESEWELVEEIVLKKMHVLSDNKLAELLLVEKSRVRKINAAFKTAREKEIARCSYFASNLSNATGGLCTDYRCPGQDYCTYRHQDADIPPRCRFFDNYGCKFGDCCSFNHLLHIEALKLDEECYYWAAGECDDENCQFRHSKRDSTDTVNRDNPAIYDSDHDEDLISEDHSYSSRKPYPSKSSKRKYDDCVEANTYGSMTNISALHQKIQFIFDMDEDIEVSASYSADESLLKNVNVFRSNNNPITPAKIKMFDINNN